MSNFQYKVVPFIGKVKGNQRAEVVSQQLQEIISENSQNGWELFQVTSTNIEVAPGCLAGLLGAKVTYETFDQVVFRKNI